MSKAKQGSSRSALHPVPTVAGRVLPDCCRRAPHHRGQMPPGERVEADGLAGSAEVGVAHLDEGGRDEVRRCNIKQVVSAPDC